jgi:hypothetical protein
LQLGGVRSRNQWGDKKPRRPQSGAAIQRRMSMPERSPGFYWIRWSDRADAELVARRPEPLIGQWDGRVWWLMRSDVYRFDCEVEVLSDVLAPPRQNASSTPSAMLRVAQ